MLRISRDSRVWALWIFIILGVGYSCTTGKLDWKVAGGLLATLGLPSLLREKKEDSK